MHVTNNETRLPMQIRNCSSSRPGVLFPDTAPPPAGKVAVAVRRLCLAPGSAKFLELSRSRGAITVMSRHLVLCLFVAGSLRAAGVDTEALLGQARGALWGKSGELKSLVLAGTRRIPMAQAGETEPQIVSHEFTLSILLPGRYLKEEVIDTPMGPGPSILEGFDGEKAWTDTRQTGGGNLFIRVAGTGAGEEQQAQHAREALARYLLTLVLAATPDFPIQFAYAGQAEAPDGKADVLNGSGAGDFAIRLFLDTRTHFPLMLTYNAPEQRMMVNRIRAGGPRPDVEKLKDGIASLPKPSMVEYQVRPSEYRKVNGVLLPHLITWSAKGVVTEEIEVKKYTVNPPLSPDIFRKK
jgi:hypothetical protein